MKTIHENYSRIPCQGTDCIFYDGEYEDVQETKAGSDYYGRWHEEFTFVWHGFHCLKRNELSKIRQEIYDRADRAASECYSCNKYKKPWIQAGKAFDEIKKEWTELKCPFYQTYRKLLE
jgi:hypothetical protein